jgi:hypothetical protein
MTILNAGEVAITLPWGILHEDGRHRDALLAPLTGYDDELLMLNPRAYRSALCTALLTRCVKRIGAIAPVTEEIARELLVADRIYALLMLRTAMFGARLQAVVTCPHADCHAKMNIDFDTTDVQVTAQAHQAASYPLTLPPELTGQSSLELWVRLPNGGDQEAIEPLLHAHDEEGAARRLLARCIIRLGDVKHPDESEIGRLNPLARQQIEAHLAALAPSVELILEGQCVACTRLFTFPFDFTEFVLRELAHGAGTIYREVHYLAYHYHWGEAEIMRMSRTKRRMYIELLSAHIEMTSYA